MFTKELEKKISYLKELGVNIEILESDKPSINDKVWVVYAEDFGEVNSYYLTLENAIEMALNIIDDGEFCPKELTIDIPKEKK